MADVEHRDEVSEKETSQQEKVSADDEHRESVAGRYRGSLASTAADRARRNINMKINNPLDGYTLSELKIMGSDYAKMHAITDPEDVRAFELGAILAQNPEDYKRLSNDASPEEMAVLEKEYKSRWSQPFILYLVIVLCSTCAAVQGMGKLCSRAPYGTPLMSSRRDRRERRSAILRPSVRDWWEGLPLHMADWSRQQRSVSLLRLHRVLVDGAVQLPLRSSGHYFHYLLVLCSCLLLAGLRQHLVAHVRCPFCSGFGNWTQECYSANLCRRDDSTCDSWCARDAVAGKILEILLGSIILIIFQMWTAFGIMVGYASDLAFYYVPDKANITGLNWRLMMSSAMFPAVIVCCFVFMCPESPRWYMSKGRHHAAYNSMVRLRYNKVQAARDLFYMAELLKAEENIQMGQSKILEIIRVPRNRRAMLASEIVMFMQVSPPSTLIPFEKVLSNSLPAILRRQRNRLLQQLRLQRLRLQRNLRPRRFIGFRRDKLPVRDSSNLHHRHLWPSQSPPDHIPALVPLHVLHRLQFLDPGYHRPSRMHRPGHLPLRHLLLPRRRPRALHILRRSVPSVHQECRHVPRHRNDMVLQLRPLGDVAVVAGGVQAAGRVRLVRCLEHHWLVACAVVHA